MEPAIAKEHFKVPVLLRDIRRREEILVIKMLETLQERTIDQKMQQCQECLALDKIINQGDSFEHPVSKKSSRV